MSLSTTKKEQVKAKDWKETIVKHMKYTLKNKYHWFALTLCTNNIFLISQIKSFQYPKLNILDENGMQFNYMSKTIWGQIRRIP